MIKIIYGSLLLLPILLLYLFSCTASKSPEPIIKTTPDQVITLSERPTWEVEWDKTMKEAKKEGVVVAYGPPVETTEGIRKAMEKFGIKYETISGRGAEVGQKLQTERKGGVFVADVFIGGSNTSLVINKAGALDPAEPLLLLPEVRDPRMWLGGNLRFTDKAHLNLAFISYLQLPLALNTDVIKPEELKSYKDLLNPKWKGKFTVNDPSVAGPGWAWFSSVGDGIMDWDYLRQLAKQEPVVIRDQRLQIEWIAQGKYPVGLGFFPPPYEEFKKAGAPLAQLSLSEGANLTSGHGVISMINKPAHPNAARLFLNWFLTREGQTIYSVATGFASARIDAPKDSFDAITVPDPNKKYFVSDDEDFLSRTPEHFRLAREILNIR